MDLGEEKDEEFRIETTVVDDETLDLGPFRNSGVSIVPDPAIVVPSDGVVTATTTKTSG
jgi:hypothetical protein